MLVCCWFVLSYDGGGTTTTIEFAGGGSGTAFLGEEAGSFEAFSLGAVFPFRNCVERSTIGSAGI